MRKILVTLIAVFLFSATRAQVRGVTVSGIKGIRKSLTEVIAFEKAHPLPPNFKAPLRPELEGPHPKSQSPGAKQVSRFGTLVTQSGGQKTGGTSTTLALAQSTQSNFLTIWGSYAVVSGRESPYTPPDNCGDVGTTQIIATANCRMKVFTKPSVTGSPVTTPTGTSTTTLSALVNVNLNTFFANASLGISGISDPHVRFDRLTNRWFIVAIDVNHSVDNYCCVAVSDGPNISSSSNFTIYYFNVSQTGGSSSDFFDYPTLGVDNHALYIGGNMFRRMRTFSGSTMWVVDKASLLSGSLTVTGFPNNITGTDMYSPQGVHNDDPASINGYFAGASQTYYGKLVVRRISYSGGTPTLSGDLNLTTTTTYAPKSVPTLNGTNIDGNDHRLCAAMIKKNKINGVSTLWIAQGTRLNSSGIGGSGGDRDGALWAEIGNLTGTPTILQGANLFDGVNSTSSAEYYTYPTIATNGQGHSLMGFTSAGPAKYAQAAAAGRYNTDAPGTFQPSVDFTTTGSSYNPGASRWGDFTQTVVDPVDDMTMWTFSEYVPTTNAWGVRAAQFKAPPPATPALASIPACGTTTTVTINGTSTANSGFFDPGAGYNRLAVSVSGTSNITASNIVFVSPTQIKADFTVPSNAASGTYSVTVTNPDGQTATTTFDLSCGAVTCGDPTGLTATNITSSGAMVNWNAVTSADNYDVDYSLAGQNTWINAATATTNTSATLSGLNAGTNYDWRVKANCSGGSGNYVVSQFTTTCNVPSGLGSSGITSNSAIVSWSAANSGVSYDVDYKLNSSGNWISAATATTSLSVQLSGLSASSLYDWRVRTNCSSGSSSYANAQFTTAAPSSCDAPGGLSASSVTSNSAHLSWNAVSGASSYDVDYSLTGQDPWTAAATATASTSVDLSGLSASTLYYWRVRTNCSSLSSSYSSAQFTTLVNPGCDLYEPNNTMGSAASIPTGTDIYGAINPAGDEDYYSFSTGGNQKNLQVTLSNLPADYNMQLFDSKGKLVGSSAQSGTASEIIAYNSKKPDTYYIRVYGASNADYSSACYTLNAVIGNTTFTANIPTITQNTPIASGGLKLYPVPASNSVYILYNAEASGTAYVTVVNLLGQKVISKAIGISNGSNINKLDVSTLRTGVYMLKLNNGKDILTEKLIISR